MGRQNFLSKYKILLFFIVLIVIGVVYFLFRFEQTEDATVFNYNQESSTKGISDDESGHKVYRNEKYGYEVKYPRDWLGGETRHDTDQAIFSSTKCDGDCGRGVIIVQVHENTFGISAIEWWEEQDKIDKSRYIYEGETEIDGIVGYLYDEDVDTLDAGNFVVFAKEDKIFKIYKVPGYKPVFNEFIKTFRFINN